MSNPIDPFDPEIESIDANVREHAQVSYDISSIIVNMAALRGLNMIRESDQILQCSNIRSPESKNCRIYINDGGIKVIYTRFLRLKNMKNISVGHLTGETKECVFNLSDPECFEKLIDFVEKEIK